MVSIADIRETMAELDRVFHNEKDFHIAFSRQLESIVSGDIRPEFPIDNPLSDGRDQSFIDVIHFEDGHTAAIELKYPLDTFSSNESLYDLDEAFRHSDINAYDVPMYEFWKDVATIEQSVEHGDIDTGYILSLTNYKDCWEKRGQYLNASDFLMYEGRTATGRLSYSEEASAQTHEDYPPIYLSDEYVLSWNPYNYSYPSNPEGEKIFQYTLIEVSPEKGPSDENSPGFEEGNY